MNSSRASWSQLSIPRTYGVLSLRFVRAFFFADDSFEMRLHSISQSANILRLRYCTVDGHLAQLSPCAMTLLCERMPSLCNMDYLVANENVARSNRVIKGSIDLKPYARRYC